MHKMSKESASALVGLQSRLTDAEAILIKVLEDEDVTRRKYLVDLVTTYFSKIRGRETTDGRI